MTAKGRRRAGLAAATILLAAGAGWAVDRGLGTCEWLDRWLERSGCVAKAHIADFQPLPFTTMMPAGEERMRIFGMRAGPGSLLQPVQLVFDLAENREAERADLPFSRVDIFARPSPDGEEAIVGCIIGNVCDELRPQAVILSARDGTLLRTVDRLEDRWAFPGTVPIIFEEDHLPGTGTVLAPDRATGGLRQRDPASSDSEGGPFAVPPEPTPLPGYGPESAAVRVAPTGGRAALIDSFGKTDGTGTRVDVWDTATRAHVARLVTDADHYLRTNAAWTADGRHLVAFRSGGSRAPNEGVDLYVFRLR